MDLSEFSQKFGAQAAPNYHFRGEPFNLKFSRYENGNWQVNLVAITQVDMPTAVTANEITVAVKSHLADDFLALNTQKQEYLKFLLQNNIIIKHPFFTEKIGNPGEIRQQVNEIYQLTPDFVSYVQQQSGYDLTTQHDVALTFELDRPTSGFTRLIFERDAQLRENPDLGKNDNNPSRSAKAATKVSAGNQEEQIKAANIIEDLTYQINGNDVPVEFHVSRYAVDGNWYLDLRERDTNNIICIISDHGAKSTSKYQVYLNLKTPNGTGDQMSSEWLAGTEMFNKIDTELKKGELNSIGLLVLAAKL